ncbi:MAG: MBL fold metallo-hydrolase [Myxococcales bacterium]|nr:MBL fold metallo-hydrolase [Myxococcota bacterium]MDW8281602.1 MBL fold metallo-hydrolase [Myxococcales bacterium]
MQPPTRKVAMLAALLGGILATACGPTGPGGQPDEPEPPPTVEQCSESETRRLADGVYSFRRGLYSTMFVVGKGGVVAFDPLGNEAACLERAIRDRAPGLLVRHIIYSHGDVDHIAGADRLPLAPGVRVYAQRQAVVAMAMRGSGEGVLPVTDVLDVNSDGSGTPTVLTLLGRRIALYYFGPTKSSGNLFIYLPDEKVAMLADVLMADTAPGTILAAMSPQGVLRTLAELDRLPFRHLVVGHGPPASHDDVSQTLAFWTSYISQARASLARTSIRLSREEALEGAPLLKVLPQLPVQEVVEALRPYYGSRIGFDRWGANGFNFAYVFLRGESAEPVVPLSTEGTPPPMSLQRVGPSAYYAQVGPYGSLVLDPDPVAREALVLVNPLGEHAAWLRQLLRANLPGRRVGHIIYTHSHNDHIANAAVVCDGSLAGVRIYAHENTARDLRDRRNPSVAQPTDIIAGEGRDLEIGRLRVELRWFGPSFTDGNLVVHVPSERVAMAVGLAQRGALPGLWSVQTDPAGLYRALSALASYQAQVYLTGEGGWMSRGELETIARAARDMLAGAAAAMKGADPGAEVPLGAPVGPAMRTFVEGVGNRVAQSLTAAYPMLHAVPQAASNVGELGVSYCSARSPWATGCSAPLGR